MKIIISLIFISAFSVPAFATNITLAEQLEAKAQASAKKTPTEVKKIMIKAINDLRKTDILEKAKKKGDTSPNFTLKDPVKGIVKSSELLQKGPLIISFYRGSWCPYCNLQLRDLQSKLSEIKATGANLVAISPEAPDGSLKTVKEQNLDFYVLSDTEGKVIKDFGLMYELPSDLITVYKKFGINLPKANRTKKWTLPISATYIVNKNGKIIYSFLDADYKKRAETKELIQILKKIN